MVRIGNFFFHYRNGLFPLFYVLLFVNSPALLPDYRMAALAGFLIAFAGQLLRAVTIGLEYIIRGGKNRRVHAERLVQGGLFSHCRNPLYVGNFTILLGVGVASNSVLFMATAIPFFAFAYWAIIAAEENFLRGKFGAEFDAYCKRVNRLVPRLSGLSRTLSAMRFNWRNLISAEYGSTFIWLAAVILVTLKNTWRNGDYQKDNPTVVALWGAFALVSLAYGVARFLKKTGRLNPPVAALPSKSTSLAAG
jgi:protein-S-isoprenylcysteine O-methyltransferase Ste14